MAEIMAAMKAVAIMPHLYTKDGYPTRQTNVR